VRKTLKVIGWCLVTVCGLVVVWTGCESGKYWRESEEACAVKTAACRP
jgi:hypothetical protein